MKVRFISYPSDASKIDGIRSIREATGLTLKEAKDTIEDLQRGISFTFDVRNVEAVEVFRKFGGTATYSYTDLINTLIELTQKAVEVQEFDLASDLLVIIKKHSSQR